MDQKGYVMGGLSFLLILPAILLVAVLADMTHVGGESVGLVLQSDTTFYAAKDIERNVPLMGSQALKETANDVVTTGIPVGSSAEIKDKLQTQMNLICAKYRDNIGADNVSCTILGFGPSSDPFLIEVNSTIYVKKGTSVHEETITQDIDIKGLPDPLPFIKIKQAGLALPSLDNNTGRISYGSSLKNYLNSKGLDGSVYNNATSPGFITQCNFEPYANTKDGHGANLTLPVQSLNLCLNNGYYHESSDGACYLCRLQGLAICPHYGIETFIVPSASNNNILSSATVSVDHVIFEDTNRYSGQAFIYNQNPIKFPTTWNKLYLDNGHRQKYGLPTY